MMICSYCGCKVIDDSEYCFFCKAELPLNPQQKKRYRCVNWLLVALLAVQLIILAILSVGLVNGGYAKTYLRANDAEGFVSHVMHSGFLRNNPEVNDALAVYLKDLSTGIKEQSLPDVDLALKQYDQLLKLCNGSSDDLIEKTINSHYQQFAQMRSVHEKLERLKSPNDDSVYSCDEVLQILDDAYNTFIYSEQEYKELCETVFSACIDNLQPKSVVSTINGLNSARDKYTTNQVLYDTSGETVYRMYQQNITDAIVMDAFGGTAGAVALAIRYADDELSAEYGNDLVDTVHNQLQLYLAELLQTGEYETIFTLLDKISYSTFDKALNGNGEHASYYRELHATAVSLHIAQRMDIHSYVSFTNTGAVQIAHRYAEEFPEDVDFEAVLQTAIAYEQNQLLQQINQKRRENGYSGLKNNADLLEIANDYALRQATGKPYDNGNDTFRSFLISHGYDPTNYGWHRAAETADTGLQCYTAGTSEAWDWFKSKEWLTDIGIGVYYHEDEETFYWYIIAIGS